MGGGCAKILNAQVRTWLSTGIAIRAHCGHCVCVIARSYSS
jgi:hypothetical protein